MRILYLSYWNLNDPLTPSTVYPHLDILQRFDFVSLLVFVNTERDLLEPDLTSRFHSNKKVIYAPLLSNHRLGPLNKIIDFILFPRKVARLLKRHNIDVVVARGAPAGALGYLATKKSTIPFIVESFEPHADYMRESGVWSVYDPRYLFQSRWEKKQRKHAMALFPVADHYRERLIQQGSDPEKLITVPCSVDTDVFYFDPVARERMRQQFNIGDDDVVGVYAGKYGGLYLEEVSFKLYEAAFQSLRNFYLVILSPSEFHEWIWSQVTRLGFPSSRVLVKFVPHDTIPDYLNMSDFAFATYKPGASKKFLSPVKLGEFWACGLPVVLTEGIGDESDFLEARGAGVLFDPERLDQAHLTDLYQRLEELLIRPEHRKELEKLAAALRSRQKAVEAYRRILLS